MQMGPTDYAVADHWRGGFDEKGLQTWAENLRHRLSAPQVSLGLLFMTPEFFPVASQVLELLRVHARIPLLMGCSSQSLIAGPEELEEKGGLVLGLYFLPAAQLQAFRFTQDQIEEATGGRGSNYWHMEMGLDADKVNGWLVFA